MRREIEKKRSLPFIVIITYLCALQPLPAEANDPSDPNWQQALAVASLGDIYVNKADNADIIGLLLPGYFTHTGMKDSGSTWVDSRGSIRWADHGAGIHCPAGVYGGVRRTSDPSCSDTGSDEIGNDLLLPGSCHGDPTLSVTAIFHPTADGVNKANAAYFARKWWYERYPMTFENRTWDATTGTYYQPPASVVQEVIYKGNYWPIVSSPTSCFSSYNEYVTQSNYDVGWGAATTSLNKQPYCSALAFHSYTAGSVYDCRTQSNIVGGQQTQMSLRNYAYQAANGCRLLRYYTSNVLTHGNFVVDALCEPADLDYLDLLAQLGGLTEGNAEVPPSNIQAYCDTIEQAAYTENVEGANAKMHVTATDMVEYYPDKGLLPGYWLYFLPDSQITDPEMRVQYAFNGYATIEFDYKRIDASYGSVSGLPPIPKTPYWDYRTEQNNLGEPTQLFQEIGWAEGGDYKNCQRSCEASSSCKQWTYEPPSAVSWPQYSEAGQQVNPPYSDSGKCYWGETVTPKVSATTSSTQRYVSGVKLPKNRKAGAYVSGTPFYEWDFLNLSNGYIDCATKCVESNKCFAYEFAMTTGHCKLFDGFSATYIIDQPLNQKVVGWYNLETILSVTNAPTTSVPYNSTQTLSAYAGTLAPPAPFIGPNRRIYWHNNVDGVMGYNSTGSLNFAFPSVGPRRVSAYLYHPGPYYLGAANVGDLPASHWEARTFQVNVINENPSATITTPSLCSTCDLVSYVAPDGDITFGVNATVTDSSQSIACADRAWQIGRYLSFLGWTYSAAVNGCSPSLTTTPSSYPVRLRLTATDELGAQDTAERYIWIQNGSSGGSLGVPYGYMSFPSSTDYEIDDDVNYTLTGYALQASGTSLPYATFSWYFRDGWDPEGLGTFIGSTTGNSGGTSSLAWNPDFPVFAMGRYGYLHLIVTNPNDSSKKDMVQRRIWLKGSLTPK